MFKLLSMENKVIETNVPGGGTEIDHQMLRDMKALYENSISNNKLDDLVPLLDENFSFVTFTDSEFDIKNTTFTEFKKEWNETREKMLENGSYHVKLNPERSLIFGDVAVARGTAEHKIIKGDGTTYDIPGKWTVILRKNANDWKIVRAHSSISAFDNSLLHGHVKQQLIKTGAGSALIGLLIGVVATFLILKLKKV